VMPRDQGGGPETRRGGPGQGTTSSTSSSTINTGTNSKSPRREQGPRPARAMRPSPSKIAATRRLVPQRGSR
jgi:hypothetical protein